MQRPFRHRRRLVTVTSVLLLAATVGPANGADVRAQNFQRIQGEGSSWAGNAIDDMRVNVEQFGISLDYNPSGSTSGRKNFIEGLVDFAASDIPFQFEPEDGSAPENPAPGSYAYIPVVAGGAAFAYNLKIGGRPVTNLRLSGENVSKIFTSAITQWNDPAIQADNPGLVMPARQIFPVVRSDGSGSTAQFTRWMIAEHPAIWNDFCDRSGRAPQCGVTSNYPTYKGMIGQVGDPGVIAGVVGPQSEGAIGYVNYSYALFNSAPVVKVLNKAGFYTEPTPENVAVSLLKADINRDESNPAAYLTQVLDGVYNDTDPRNYPLSSYSYFILPTTVFGNFNEDKGYTLSVFANYAMCQAQQRSASLGYSPMPISLVRAALEQIRKIPGAVADDIDVSRCDNPTFDAADPDNPNKLASIAPQPQECDRQGTLQCPDGTGGLGDVPTAVAGPAAGGTAGSGSSATSGGPTGGGTTGGGSTDGDGAAAGGDDAGTGGGETGVGATGSGATGGGVASGSGAGSGSTGTGSTGATGTGTTGALGTGSTGALGTGTENPGGIVGGGADGAACDPDTGECTPAAVADGSVVDPATGQVVSPGAGANVGAVTPTNLDGGPGIGHAVLVLLVIVLALALVLGPAFAWRYLSVGSPA